MMKTMLTRSGKAAALAVALASGTCAWAQRPGEGVARKAEPGDLPATGVMSPRENDSRIARWLAVDNKMIVEGAKIGKERATSSDVKSFADAMLADHEKCVKDLEAVKGNKDDGAAASRNQNDRKTLGDTTPDRRRTAVLIQDDGKSRGSAAIYHPTDFLAVHEDVFNHMKNSMKKEWEGVSTEEFDRAFMKHQVMAHEMLLATMQSVRSTASTEMRKSLDDGIAKTKDHLKQARELCDQVSKTNKTRATR